MAVVQAPRLVVPELVAVVVVSAAAAAAKTAVASVILAVMVMPEVAAVQPYALVHLVNPGTTCIVAVNSLATKRPRTPSGGLFQNRTWRASDAPEEAHPWRGYPVLMALTILESQRHLTRTLSVWPTWRAGPRQRLCGLVCFPA